MSDLQPIDIQPADEGGYLLSTEQFIQRPRDEVFSLFADAMELQRLTPPWLHFQVLTPPPMAMRQGLLLDYKIRLHHVPIRWRTLIEVWEPPFKFVDVQLKGPYARWHHTHTFHEQDGGTLVRDTVHYIPRGGRLIHQWLVRPDLIKIFNYRREQLNLIFPPLPEAQDAGVQKPAAMAPSFQHSSIGSQPVSRQSAN